MSQAVSRGMTPGEVRWRCRRGNLELDRLLGRYLRVRYPVAPPEERAAFESLLRLEDPVLLDLLTGRSPAVGDEALVVVWFLGTAAD